MGLCSAWVNRFLKWVELAHNFRSSSAEKEAFLSSVNKKNHIVISAAAVLAIVIELIMVIRVFVYHPTLDTVASRIYLSFYLSLILIALFTLLVQPRTKDNAKKQYWTAFIIAMMYLIWNMLLNSYDLYRTDQGSALSMIMAIVLTSVLLQFKPLHMMSLQLCTYLVFLSINRFFIKDNLNAGIALTIAISTNFLFYFQQMQIVRRQIQISQMRQQIENEQLEGARRYLRRLQSAQQKTAIYHHDMRHTFHLLQQLLQRGEYKKMYAVITDNEAQLQAVQPVFHCAHEVANLLFGSFEERTRNQNITFEVTATLPKTLPLSDTELCALLCNLLENALHAVQKMEPTAQRRIYVRAVYTAPNLVFFVENTFRDKVKMAQARPIRETPTAQHGFGVQSIIDIAERYHGLYDFTVDGKTFRAKVLLKLPTE